MELHLLDAPVDLFLEVWLDYLLFQPSELDLTEAVAEVTIQGNVSFDDGIGAVLTVLTVLGQGIDESAERSNVVPRRAPVVFFRWRCTHEDQDGVALIESPKLAFDADGPVCQLGDRLDDGARSGWDVDVG